MTAQQKIYYDAIKRYIAHNKCSPTYAEIGKMVGVTSLCSVYKMVDRLVDQGYLIRDPNTKYRNLHVIPNKIDGFNYCDRAHVPIWFQPAVCPMCALLQKIHPPREVSVS